jgi:hypothetical protein
VGGGGAKSYDSKKACSSINHSILSSTEKASLRYVNAISQIIFSASLLVSADGSWEWRRDDRGGK